MAFSSECQFEPKAESGAPDALIDDTESGAFKGRAGGDWRRLYAFGIWGVTARGAVNLGCRRLSRRAPPSTAETDLVVAKPRLHSTGWSCRPPRHAWLLLTGVGPAEYPWRMPAD